MIKHFQKDVLDLSRDRVVNVRLSLASAFYFLHKTLDKLETQYLNSSNTKPETKSKIQ